MDKKKLPKTDVEVRPLRTFEDDMAQAVEKQKESVISMSVKEQEKNQKEAPPKPQKKSSKKYLIYLSFLFIFLGIVALGYYFYESKPKEEPRAIIDTIIIADEETDVNLDSRNALIDAIGNGGGKSSGIVTHLNTKLDAQEFLEAVGANPPSVLLRSMNGDSMFGLIQLEEAIPFWIAEVDSYESALGGLLSWESTLAQDMAPVFSNSEVPADATFQDLLSKNKDVRILKNSSGEVIFMYAFLDKNTIILTRNTRAFGEILPLFISSKQIR